MTHSEVLLWQLLRNRPLHGWRFLRRYTVGPYIFDFACPGSEVLIEIAGETHASPVAQAMDQAKDEAALRVCYTVIRVSDKSVLEDAAAVAERIGEVLLRRGCVPESRVARKSKRQNPLTPLAPQGGRRPDKVGQ